MHTELSDRAPLYLLDPEFAAWVQNAVMEWRPTIAWTGIMLAMQARPAASHLWHHILGEGHNDVVSIVFHRFTIAVVFGFANASLSIFSTPNR